MFEEHLLGELRFGSGLLNAGWIERGKFGETFGDDFVRRIDRAGFTERANSLRDVPGDGGLLARLELGLHDVRTGNRKALQVIQIIRIPVRCVVVGFKCGFASRRTRRLFRRA